MALKVVGCELREGEFQGTAYKHYLLYVVDAQKGKNELFGVCPHAIKVKDKFVQDNGINLKELYQQQIEVYYDAYKNVAKIERL